MTRIAPLHSSRDFRRVMSRGTRIKASFATAFVERSPGSTRLGLAVPGAVGSAVRRNRIKRRLRAAFRGAGVRDVHLVVRATPEAELVPFQEMEDFLRRAGTS